MDVNAFLGYSLEDEKIASHDPNQQKIYLDPGAAADLPDNVVIIDPVVFRSNMYLRPKYKHIIANKHGLPHDQFIELYGWKTIIGKRDYRILLSLFRKWRGRLVYREFKGKSKRGY